MGAIMKFVGTAKKIITLRVDIDKPGGSKLVDHDVTIDIMIDVYKLMDQYAERAARNRSHMVKEAKGGLILKMTHLKRLDP
jgi:hypothetical protein